MTQVLGLTMMGIAVASLLMVAFQDRLFQKRGSDPEGREELREMEARMLANRRRGADRD